MIYLVIIISSGLFLGWLLGSNDTVNLFGSSVSSKMLNFKKAAFIASIFILLGAVLQGRGTTTTIHSIGNVSQAAIAFIIALSAGLTVLFLTRIKLPVSTSQAIVGSILGWALFIHKKVDFPEVSKIFFAWILAPFIGLLLGAMLFIFIRWIIKHSHIHLLKLDYWLRIGLIAGISLSAFGLGANNIGNVIGVFSNFAPKVKLEFGLFSLDGLQILFILGSIAIASGIFTYSFRSKNGTGREILSLMPEGAIVVLFAQAIVLFLFSSAWFAGILNNAGLPSFPLVPVSSTQIVVGAVLGIGLVKGAREIQGKTLAGIGLGWLATPFSAGTLTYSILTVLQNGFGYTIEKVVLPSIIQGKSIIPETGKNITLVLPGLAIIVVLLLGIFLYLLFRQQKLRLKIEKDMLLQQNELYLSQKTMNELEMRTIAMENETLSVKLKAKRKEFMDIALNINEQRIFYEKISSEISDIIKIQEHDDRTSRLKELLHMIRQKMSFVQEKKEFYMQIEEVHKDFHMKLKTSFPNLTELEKRLAGLLRLNLTSKEISSLLNISPKSVEVARYRLKKKMNLQKERTLNEFINNL